MELVASRGGDSKPQDAGCTYEVTNFGIRNTYSTEHGTVVLFFPYINFHSSSFFSKDHVHGVIRFVR